MTGVRILLLIWGICLGSGLGYFCGFEDGITTVVPVRYPCVPLEVSAEGEFACVDNTGQITIHAPIERKPAQVWSAHGSKWMTSYELKQLKVKAGAR